MTVAWRTGAADTSEGLGAGAIYTARSARGGPFRGAAALSPAGITGRAPVAAGSPLGVLVSWDKFGGTWPADPPGAGLVYTWVAARGSGAWLPAQPLAAPRGLDHRPRHGLLARRRGAAVAHGAARA